MLGIDEANALADATGLVRVAYEDTQAALADEVFTLIGVEDIRLAVTRQRILQRRDAECRLHRDRQPPRQHTTAEPVEHCLLYTSRCV